MKHKGILRIALFLCVDLFSTAVVAEGFWEGKPKLIERTREQREILVFVEEKRAGKDKKTLKLQAMGMIHMPVEEAARHSIDYDRLKNLSSVVKSLSYNAQQNILKMETKAFNYTASFVIKTIHKLDQDKPEIEWQVIGGFFKGMHLKYVFSPSGPRKTQIALYGQHQYKNLGIPQFFIEFGMGVVMQKAAEKLRTQLEERFKD